MTKKEIVNKINEYIDTYEGTYEADKDILYSLGDKANTMNYSTLALECMFKLENIVFLQKLIMEIQTED